MTNDLAEPRSRRALVLGGSGYVGASVTRLLRTRGIDVVCTYFRSEKQALALASETGARAVACDLTDAEAIRQLVSASAGEDISIIVHAAGQFSDVSFGDVTPSDIATSLALAVSAPLLVVKEIAARKHDAARLDVVLVTALGSGQSLPLPPHFAAGEGAKGALAMSLAKELGARNVRVNAVSVGLLEDGMSAKLGAEKADDFAAFSALGRRGTADEVAKVIAFLVLDSDFLTGKTVAVNGGV